ncbi:TLC domain-containing protein 4 C (Transmembrane protein 56 homolog C), partial [Durusdinium trenchii]
RVMMLHENATWVEHGLAYAGQAGSHVQLQRMIMSYAFFVVLHAAVMVPIMRSWVGEKKFNALPSNDQYRLGGYGVSMFHAVVGVAFASFLLVFDTNINEDHLNGHSDGSMSLLAFTAAYFMWDFGMVFRMPEIEMSMVVHHVIGIITVLTLTHPCFLFYGICCVMFEASTPFLSMRKILLMRGYKGTRILGHIEKLFGISFLLCRVIFGIPMVLYAFVEGTNLLLEGAIPYPSKYVILLTTCWIQTFLNCFWFHKIVKMGLKSSTKAGGESPATATTRTPDADADNNNNKKTL